LQADNADETKKPADSKADSDSRKTQLDDDEKKAPGKKTRALELAAQTDAILPRANASFMQMAVSTAS